MASDVNDGSSSLAIRFCEHAAIFLKYSRAYACAAHIAGRLIKTDTIYDVAVLRLLASHYRYLVTAHR